MRRAVLAALVLIAAAPAAFAGTYACGGGARLLPGNRCSDGAIAIYRADTLAPPPAATRVARGRTAATPEIYRAHEAHVFTPRERQRKMDNTDRAARDLARRWSPQGRPLNAAQERAIANQRCLVAAATNPDVRCAPR